MGGRKKMKLLRRLAQEANYEKMSNESSRDGDDATHQSVKQLTKKQKRNKSFKKRQVAIAKEHRWYLVKVYDSTPPSKSFLQESFSTLLDTEFTMLGFHHSTTSTRFYLENNSAAATALTALNKRMQGCEGRLMQIQTEPCQSFLVLNAQQMAYAKKVLERRFDAATCILDLSNFHHDSLFLEHNMLPVLWDPAILRQILTIIRDNIPNLIGIVLSKNALKLANVRVLAGTLGKCPLQGINLEHNEIENVKELINILSVFPVVELKLEGNNCLKDIKNPVTYIKTVQCKLEQLKTLDGVDIVGYLASNAKDSERAANTSAASTSADAVAPKAVTEALMQQFITQYYLCIDTDQRLQLVNAYIPNAVLTIDSEVQGIPKVMCIGHEQIREMFNALPATHHAKETFSYKLLSLEPCTGAVEIAGQLQLQGREQVVAFVHRFNIIPYNTGLGCTLSAWSFR